MINNTRKYYRKFQNNGSAVRDFTYTINGSATLVDYNDTLDNGSKIRSSTGLAVDWLTPIGPLSFSFAQPISKTSTDSTERFRFDIGTTF